MDQKLNKVKHTFDKIKDMREEISGLFQNLDCRISKLRKYIMTLLEIIILNCLYLD